MHITPDGQVTIPKTFRKKFGLSPNTPVKFVVKGGELVLKKSPAAKRKGKKLSLGAEAVRHMTGRGSWSMTTDELMELFRGE